MRGYRNYPVMINNVKHWTCLICQRTLHHEFFPKNDRQTRYCRPCKAKKKSEERMAERGIKIVSLENEDFYKRTLEELGL